MPIPFPSDAWVKALMEQLNSSAAYAETAKNWEGDISFVVEPDPGGGALAGPVTLYVDLWHGQCRGAYLVADSSLQRPAFVLSATLSTFAKIIGGKLDPIQALLTRQLRVKGSMVALMRNVPTVLEFVKICQLVDSEFPS